MKSKQKFTEVTIQLPGDLIERVKKAALMASTTLKGFIERALRNALGRRQNGKIGREFKVITYGHGGVRPGVNLDDSSALQDIMEPPEEIRDKLIG
jgi:hypothetical protein